MKKWKFTAAMLFGALSVLLLCMGCGKDAEVLFSEESSTAQASEAVLAQADRQTEETTPASEASADTTESAVQQTVFVHVCGAVATPGVYELAADARIYEAVAMAGGGTQEACTDAINLAQNVSDGMRVYVPTVQEAADASAGWVTDGTDGTETAAQTDASDTGLVNINTATKEELMTLPGIGEAKAESIVAYREQNGAFSSIEDIMQVSGIKESTFEKMKDRIKV